jgi:hypothetical protein
MPLIENHAPTDAEMRNLVFRQCPVNRNDTNAAIIRRAFSIKSFFSVFSYHLLPPKKIREWLELPFTDYENKI